MADATPRTTRRTWPQRLTILVLVLASVASFAAAGALAAGQWVVSNRSLVVLDAPSAVDERGEPVVVLPGDTTAAAGDTTTTTAPAATFPPAEPDARNFLITGADNNACIDPDSPYAPAFGDRENFGERSDTIMVWRVNPATQQVAVLSFPRDLYVSIDGGSKGRINTAYRRDDPDRLRSTIFSNFGIEIDHYVQVDFCAFKRLVDAVGGVEVPFEYPARDQRSGLDVPTTGCFNFDGEHALAYVRSRYYDYEDPPGSGNWKRDGTSDLGRISRQQDFLRRTVGTVVRRGAYTPSVLTALLETNREYLTVDSELTLSRMLEFAGVLRSLQGGDIASYQIESSPQTVSGNAVLIPRLEGSNMQAILSVFRGEATLAGAPEQEFDSTTSLPPRPGAPTSEAAEQDAGGDDARESDETGNDQADDDAADDSIVNGATTTLPVITAEENTLGISPPRDVTC
jgi:LCP family protein required for cell wall assembly